MGADYGEKICQAIDEIVTAKLQGLQYDITKLCTIVDDTYSYQGKYTVSDGTARYDAFTTDVSLKKGNQVQVTIPNGDYSLQKTIVGRIATTDTTPFNYTSPLDTMITITNNVFDSAKTIYGENAGLLANGPRKLLGPIYSLEGEKELAGYTRLGLSANFRSWLNGLDVISGSYGIKVLLYTDIMEQASGVSTNEVVYELTFSSADMIGNPYQFDDYFYQEKVFDISNVNNIKRLEVYFYQDSAFLNGSNELVSYQDVNELLGTLEDKPNNLFVDDVQLFMGYEIGYFTDETLMLYTPDTLSYSYKREELKEINLRWIHKIDEKTYEIINENNFDSDIYEIRWFKYNPGYEIIDQYAGKDWELVQNGNFTYYLAPEVKNQTEQIKVIGLIKGEISDENIQDITPYFSNLLVFENEELVPDQTTLKASTALSIYCLDRSEGNYFLYNQNGKLSNEGLGKGYTRYFKAMYQGAEITDDIGTINWIKWYFPIEATMLLTDDSMYAANNGEITNREYSYKGVDYVEITREPKDGEMPSLEQSYAIENIWTAQKANNTVMCRISINGVEYEALEQLNFGKAGTNGTNVTFLIEFTGNVNALTAGSSDKVEVRARLYTEADGAAGGLPVGASVQWEWYKESNSKYMTMTVNSLDTSYCLLQCNTSTIPTDNYYILKATYEGLEAYLPIPIKKNCDFIEGAREIIYDHQGNPNYYNDVYTCWTLGENGYEEITGDWKLNYSESTDGSALQQGFIPTLQEAPNRKGYKVLSASPFYSSGYNDKVCVSLSNHWSQPILIMQSKYDFAMLNEWDGTLKINDEDGTILSTMLGAGKKNSDNTYSGVLIGDVQGGSGLDAAAAQTGIYGIHKGKLSYTLKEDGTATFGKKGKGQIKLDGNSGTIKSGNYDINATGTLIDLDNGVINIKNNGETKVYISPNISGEDAGAYLTINGTGSVPLIQVSEGKYFLQSHSHGISNNQGTFLDLNDGTFNIQGSAGTIELSGDSDKNLFKITDKAKQTLIEMNNDNYYLKSSTYSGQAIKTIDEYSMYKNTKTSIKNGSGTTSFTSTVGLKDGHVYNYDGSDFTPVTFYTTTINLGTYETEDGTKQSTYTYTGEEYKKWFISYLEPLFTDVTPSGLHIDLNQGSIIGYDLFLRGIQSGNSSRSFTFDSSADEYPILVGDNLKISWDGSLWCNKLTRMVNDGRDYIISIDNNFYVDQNGNAGATSNWQGGCSGYAGGVRGYSPTSISSGGKTYTILGA